MSSRRQTLNEVQKRSITNSTLSLLAIVGFVLSAVGIVITGIFIGILRSDVNNIDEFIDPTDLGGGASLIFDSTNNSFRTFKSPNDSILFEETVDGCMLVSANVTIPTPVLNQLGPGLEIKGSGNLDVKAILAGTGLIGNETNTSVVIEVENPVTSGYGLIEPQLQVGFSMLSDIDFYWSKTGQLVHYYFSLTCNYTAGSELVVIFFPTDAGAPQVIPAVTFAGHGNWVVGNVLGERTFGTIAAIQVAGSRIIMTSSTLSVANPEVTKTIRASGSYLTT